MPAVNAEDLANAEVELQQAARYADKSKVVDANDNGATLASLRSHGLEEVAAPIAADKENPDIVRIIHHAYDGRTVPIPEYMAKVRLSERFPREDWIPNQFHGKRVWFLEPQPEQPRQHLLCYLHEDQTPEIKAEVANAGYTPGRCKYNQGPSTALVEKHMSLKHKDEWKAIKEMRDRAERADANSDVKAQTAAILELAKSMATRIEAK